MKARSRFLLLLLLPIVYLELSSPFYLTSVQHSTIRSSRYDTTQQTLSSLSLSSTSSSSSSSSSTSIQSSSISEWSRLVYDLDRPIITSTDPRLCKNAQFHLLPRPAINDPLGPCVEPSGYEIGPNPNWRKLGGKLMQIDRHGINRLDTDPLGRASFEKTVEQLINAAVFNEVDHMKSVSSRIMAGLCIKGGTGLCNLILDKELLENSEYTTDIGQLYKKTYNDITIKNNAEVDDDVFIPQM